MRVLQTDSTPTYQMGKNRKHRLRKNRENDVNPSDSSDEGGAAVLAGCPHINKAVNFAAMKKTILKSSYGQCGLCSRDTTHSGSQESASAMATAEAGGGEAEDLETEVTVWVCLQCGNQGCDRNSRGKHALRHFETPHSGAHCIVLNLTSWLAWCYTCDDFILIENSKRIQECVEFLRKQAGLPRLDYAQAAARRSQSTTGKGDAPPVEPQHQASAKEKSKPLSSKTPSASSCHKVKGLSNLGNTCFFNAVMQNLSQTHSLESLLVDRTRKGRSCTIPGSKVAQQDSECDSSSEDESEDDVKELPAIEIEEGEAGPLTRSLLGFLQEMNNSSSRGATVNPSGLFGQICKKAPRFKGFQQQDSHELLHYLLDVIRTEEVKRYQSGILKHFKLSESTNPKRVDDDLKFKIKEYGRQVKHTFLDSLMGGQLISTVMCEECKHISQTFESFLDLSLPVTEEKPQRPNLVLGGKKKEGGGVEVEGAASLDSLIPHVDRPSKYSQKKGKKAARKEARRKARQSQRLSASAEEAVERDDRKECEEDVPEEEGIGDKGEESKKEEDLEANDSNSSQREDPSDADVEDNLESDTSRLANQNNTADDSSLQDRDNDGDSAFNMKDSGITVETERSCVEEGTDLSHDGVQSEAKTASNCKSEEADTAQRNGELESELNGADEDVTSVFCGKDAKKETIPTSEEWNNETKTINAELNPETIVTNTEVNAETTANHEDVISVSYTVVMGNETVLNVTNGQIANGTQECIESPRVETDVNNLSQQLEQLDVSNSGNRTRSDNCEHDEDPQACAEQVKMNGDTEDVVNSVQDEGRVTWNKDILGDSGFTALPDEDAEHKIPHQARSRKEVKKLAQYRLMKTMAPRYQPSAKECSVMSCMQQFTSAELLMGKNKVACDHCSRLRHKSSFHKDKKSNETIYSVASKQYLIYQPPAVLMLHLKRFEQVGYTSRKVNSHVEFPFQLDLTPYCSSLCQGVTPGQKRVLYALYGVVEHSGRLSGGHYTAYVKVRPSMGTVTNFVQSHPVNTRDYRHFYADLAASGSCPPEADISEETIQSLVPPGRWYHISDSRVSEIHESAVQRAQAYMLFYERIY